MQRNRQVLGDPHLAVGVLVPVPEPQRETLRSWRQEFGNPAEPSVEPHITLLNGTFAESWQATADFVRKVAQRTSGFTVRLCGARSFRPLSQVVYLPLVQGADECRALHQQLLHGSLRHESSYDYQPHLTIAQDLDAQRLDRVERELCAASLSFRAQSLQLFDAQNGQWNLREEIALHG